MTASFGVSLGSVLEHVIVAAGSLSSLALGVTMNVTRCLFVNRERLPSDSLNCKEFQIELTFLFPLQHGLSVPEQTAQYFGKSLRVARGNENACFSLFKQFRNSVYIGRDDGAASFPRFRQHQRSGISM